MKISIKNYIKYIIYVLAVLSLIFIFLFYSFLYPLKYKDLIRKYAEINNIEPSLIASIICVESSYNEKALSSKGALGLMQIMPKTAQWICEQNGEIFSSNNLYNPEFNIKIGSYYIDYLQKKFDNTDYAIIAYNAGEGIVSEWIKKEIITYDNFKNIPYKETLNYFFKVKKAIKIYSNRL